MTSTQNTPQESQAGTKGAVWLWAGVALLAFAGAAARIISAEPAAKPANSNDTECAEIISGKRQAETLQHIACMTSHGYNLQVR